MSETEYECCEVMVYRCVNRLLILAIFLELRLAFWVAFGDSDQRYGCRSRFVWIGETLNMLSMFAFLMAVGIVVDDAIVVGENIYAHRAMNKSMFQAAVDGTSEVIGSVLFQRCNNDYCLRSLYYVSGVMVSLLPSCQQRLLQCL